MTTAQAVLDVARGFIGTGADPNRITRQYGPSGWGISKLDGGYDWCAVSTYVWARLAGGASLVSAGPFVSDHKAFHQARGTWLARTNSPRPGDEVIFDWPGTPGDQNHIGIVEAVADGRITTIEGNSGDRVARRSYPISDSRIHGFGRPKYTSTGTAGETIGDTFMGLTDAEQRTLYDHILWQSKQMQGVISTDRPAEGQLALSIQRVTEILFAVDGGAFPGVLGADGKPYPRALARFLSEQGQTPTLDVDEEALAASLAVALAPQLVAALSGDVVTTAELEAVKVELLAAISQVDEATLATFGLKRA